MVTSVSMTPYTANSGQVYLEYIMNTLESALTSTVSSSDAALNEASLVVMGTPFQRGEFELEDPYAPVDITEDVYIPKQVKNGKIISDFDDTMDALLNGLVADGVSFIENFFPSITALESSVCTKLQNMLSGVSNYDEDAMTTRATTFTAKETAAHEGLITALVVTGAVAVPTDVVRAVSYYGGAGISQLSNNQILLHAAQLLDDLDFAFSQVDEYRKNVVRGVLGFIDSVARAATAAGAVTISLELDAQSNLISAVAGYRNAMLGFEELKSRARATVNTARNEVEQAKIRDKDALAEINTQMLLDQARTYASKVSATLNGISVSGSAAHEVR